jgi:hypothetical protein
VARPDTAGLQAIGTAGVHATIERHGVAFFQGIVTAQRRQGRRPASLAAET